MGDDFPHLKVLLPSALVLTCLVQSGWSAWELTWSFSLWLEALAFLPQIIMLNKIRIVENICLVNQDMSHPNSLGQDQLHLHFDEPD